MRDVVRLELTLTPSRRLRTLAFLAYGIAIILLVSLLPDWRGGVLVALAFLLGLLQWRQRFHGSSAVFISGVRHDDQGWALRLGPVDGWWRQVQLLAPVFCHRHLVVLRFRCTGRWLPMSVAVTHDSCSADDFRRLRVLARHLPAPQLWVAPR